MSIKNVKKQVNFLLNKSDKSDMSLAANHEQIANHYRTNIQSSKDSNKVVLDVLESYPASHIMMSIDKISKEFNNRLITKSAIEQLSEWSYINGSKGKSVEDMEVPDFEDSSNLTNEINERIKSAKDLNPNDMALAIELANLVYTEYSTDSEDVDVLDSDPYMQVINILEECESFIQTKKDGRLYWDIMGRTFTEISKYIQEDILKNRGEEMVYKELKDFESDSIEEYLEQKIKP